MRILLFAVLALSFCFSHGQEGWNPKAEGKIAWQTNVGLGYSMARIANGKVYLTGHDGKETDTVFCLDEETGQEIWKHSYPQPLADLYFQGGTTGAVTIEGDRVYHIAREGELFCFNADDGTVIWEQKLGETYSEKPDWGFTGSPIPYGDTLLIAAGDAGTAVKKSDGSIVWKSKDVEHGYSTPYVFQRDGRDLAIFSSKKDYVCVDPKTGEEVWRYKWMTRYYVNAADPIVTGDKIFISSGYGKGAILLQWDGKSEPTRLWQNRDMKNQMNPSLLLGEHLYGIDGNERQDRTGLKCMKFETGETVWLDESIAHGAVSEYDDYLVVLSEDGHLSIAPVSPEKFEPVFKKKIYGGKTWTLPVLSNGRIFCRNDAGDVAVVDMRP
ncbi:MAG: PQQ-binding-like beta-propeller repeat protein [Verrucomicrobiota bacterium]